MQSNVRPTLWVGLIAELLKVDWTGNPTSLVNPRSKLAADRRHPFETLTTFTAPNKNPWKHIERITNIINNTIRKDEIKNGNRHLLQTPNTMTILPSHDHLSTNHTTTTIPTKISIFLPSLQVH